MVSTSFLLKEQFKYLELPTQSDFSEQSSVNCSLTHVAPTVPYCTNDEVDV
ncbi:MAG: hypothetical protein ABI417_07845 [Coleofasciculaceae cyanobacterium]